MTNYPSKDTFRCCVSIKCRKLPAKMTTKKKEMKEIWGFEVCFISPSHLLYTPKSSKYIQGHIDPEFDLWIPWGKWYLTYKMINYGECQAKWLQQFSGALLVSLNHYRLFYSCGGGIFKLCLFSLFLFFIEFNYSYCLWAVELKNHLLSCIFTLYLIHSQLFISAMLFRLGSEIAYLHRAKKAVSFTEGW